MLFKPRKSSALTAQIKVAEQQVLNRKQGVRLSAAALVQKIHLQMTAPTTLLLACGMGFILGETTKQKNAHNCSATGKPRTVEVSPLMTALNLMLSVHTLYRALPLAWLLKTFSRPKAPVQVTEGQTQYGAVAEAQPIMGKGQNNC